MAEHEAILLPGIVMPAELAYADLVEALAERGARAVPKELEVYGGPQPPSGYSLDLEIEATLALADAAGLERFHLVGYSGGGAISAATAARRPQRLASLALLEPAWLGNAGMSAEERETWREIESIRSLPADERMAAFVRMQLAPDVDPPAPPPGPAPDWMKLRPAGIEALTGAFEREEIEAAALARFERPVYYGLGGRSNPRYFARQAERARDVFPDFTLELFDERHHFEPPHRFEPERLADSLVRHWQRASDAS